MSKLAASISPDDDPVAALMRSIRIPPRPSLLVDLQRELAEPDPSPRKIARIIGNDVGMSGALLKLANSPFYGAARKAKSVEQGIDFLGVNQCSALITGLLARQAIDGEGASLTHFWDVSAKRAQALVFAARKLRIAPPDIAHTFGLFCDIGVPLLMRRFPDYEATFAAASAEPQACFTAVEDARHQTNHAAIGCLLARNWGLSADVSWAILLHHDYTVLTDPATDEAIRALVSASVLAENAIQRYLGNGASLEWDKGGARACQHLELDLEEADDLLEQLHELFDTDH
ncbi:MAG: HDOD domain-containing protein [Pseudomonadota bacterium]